MKTDLSKFNNSWYSQGNKLKIVLWFFVNALFFNNSIILQSIFYKTFNIENLENSGSKC